MSDAVDGHALALVRRYVEGLVWFAGMVDEYERGWREREAGR